MDTARGLLTFVARADNRVAVLLALAGGSATRVELQAETDIPRATLSRILADCRDRDLVVREGHAYALTDLGEVLADEVTTTLDAVDAVLALRDVRAWLSLGTLEFPVDRLAGADVVVPSTADPTAPIRRAETLLADASRVRLVAESMIPGCLEAVWRAVTEHRQTLEWVGTETALKIVAEDPVMTRQTRDLLESTNASCWLHEGTVPQALFVVDGVVFTPVTDESGVVRGHVETDDRVVREWADERLDGYVESAGPLGVDRLTA